MGSDEPVQEPVPNAQSNLGPRDIIALHKQGSKGAARKTTARQGFVWCDEANRQCRHGRLERRPDL